eukprot:TRINITY_DN603_c0_g1_i1.p1 TRINITY_DN603_c0_g1~~TRINITY_DN603_c0_g1_i1.p1  ORF type:complete len:397 (-),score=74.86 TRINITY_DN603_c0_g1_i1:695-1885(-)
MVELPPELEDEEDRVEEIHGEVDQQNLESSSSLMSQFYSDLFQSIRNTKKDKKPAEEGTAIDRELAVMGLAIGSEIYLLAERPFDWLQEVERPEMTSALPKLPRELRNTLYSSLTSYVMVSKPPSGSTRDTLAHLRTISDARRESAFGSLRDAFRAFLSDQTAFFHLLFKKTSFLFAHELVHRHAESKKTDMEAEEKSRLTVAYAYCSTDELSKLLDKHDIVYKKLRVSASANSRLGKRYDSQLHTLDFQNLRSPTRTPFKLPREAEEHLFLANKQVTTLFNVMTNELLENEQEFEIISSRPFAGGTVTVPRVRAEEISGPSNRELGRNPSALAALISESTPRYVLRVDGVILPTFVRHLLAVLSSVGPTPTSGSSFKRRELTATFQRDLLEETLP